MASNSFGNYLRLTTFGESHGSYIGGVIDGCPSGMAIDAAFIGLEMQRRRPGESSFASPRAEADEVEIISGVYEMRTTGAPIAFLIKNTDQRPQDYDALKEVYRPSHAEFTYERRYGHYDPRGGGRASARETAVRVAAGAIVQPLLRQNNIDVIAWVSQLGSVTSMVTHQDAGLEKRYEFPLRCPDAAAHEQMEKAAEEAAQAGDSLGGAVSCVIKGLPAGLGEPVYRKFQAELAYAMLSINAAKGFEYGEGFQAASMSGSEHNDVFKGGQGSVVPATNHAGGIIGGITTGEAVYFRVAFKPASSIRKAQKTVDKQGKPVELTIGGRHDVTVVPRAVPVVEAMARLVVADALLGRQIREM